MYIVNKHLYPPLEQVKDKRIWARFNFLLEFPTGNFYVDIV